MGRDFLYNTLMGENVLSSINDNLDYLLELIPEIKSMIGFEQNHPHHHLDVWNHTLYALSMSPNDFYVRLTLLLHDIGKPYSCQDGEVRRFRGHAKVSAKIAYKILNRLNFDYEEIDKICYLIENHDLPIRDKEIINSKNIALTRFKIQCCDALAHHPASLQKRIEYLLIINEKINEKEEKEVCKKLINKFIVN